MKYGIFHLDCPNAISDLEIAFGPVAPVATKGAHRGLTPAAVKVSGGLQGGSLLQARDRLQGPLPSYGPSRTKLPFPRSCLFVMSLVSSSERDLALSAPLPRLANPLFVHSTHTHAPLLKAFSPHLADLMDTKECLRSSSVAVAPDTDTCIPGAAVCVDFSSDRLIFGEQRPQKQVYDQPRSPKM